MEFEEPKKEERERGRGRVQLTLDNTGCAIVTEPFKQCLAWFARFSNLPQGNFVVNAFQWLVHFNFTINKKYFKLQKIENFNSY